MNDIAISIRNVSKCYRTYDSKRSRFLHAINSKHGVKAEETWALKDINFEIKRGDSVAIIGRNGGGKSTLLEIITGTLTPTTGEVTVNGRVSALLELGSGFNPEYTGRDNVILNGLLLGLSRQEILNRFDEIEAFAEIGPAIDRPVKTYSSGMMMRLAFAVQVLFDPDILIIDEALSVGDYFFQQKCLGFIRKLCEKGSTLLFVSHDLGTVRDICKQGLLLISGRLDFFGDKITAIRRYLSVNQNNTIEAENTVIPAVPENKTSELNQSIWRVISPETNSKKAQILLVNFLDSNGQPCTSVRIGAEVTVQVHFVSSYAEPVHVTIVFKNKYDQIVTSIGSYTLRTQMPSDVNGEFLFQLKINLAVESGNYTFSVKLAQSPPKIGEVGLFLDETPWLGPIQVDWNYNSDIPPFYGLVGLPARAEFLTNTDVK